MQGGGLDVAGRVVIVTGAAAGLGRAVAMAFAGRGALLCAVDRDGAGLDTLVTEAGTLDAEVLTGQLDVRDAAAVEAFCAQVGDRHGRIDVLVNNAGGTFRAPFDAVSAKGQQALVDENFTSVTHFVRACLPLMGPGASIINVTSIEAHRACPGYAVYAAMKAAVENLSRSLAVELGHRGIRVNTVAPDAIPTDGERQLSPDGAGAYEHTTPLGRLGEPHEMAGPVLFLASDLSSFVTGTTIHVDGGNDAARGWRRQPDGSFRP